MHAKEMLQVRPNDLSDVDAEVLAECIEACFACAQACTACADACLSEDAVAELTHCIRTDLDCADLCEAVGRMLSRRTAYDVNVDDAFLEACASVCGACAEACATHAGTHEHCRICAEACERCERACRRLIDVRRVVA